MSVSFESCVLSGRGLCVGLSICPGKALPCVCVCVCARARARCVRACVFARVCVRARVRARARLDNEEAVAQHFPAWGMRMSRALNGDRS
jgi:hypothetical protein